MKRKQGSASSNTLAEYNHNAAQKANDNDKPKFEVDYSSILQKSFVVIQLVVLHIFVLCVYWGYPQAQPGLVHLAL